VLLGLVMEATAAAMRRAKAAAQSAPPQASAASPDTSYLGLGITQEAAHAANAWVKRVQSRRTGIYLLVLKAVMLCVSVPWLHHTVVRFMSNR
jgi:hypothetical protein